MEFVFVGLVVLLLAAVLICQILLLRRPQAASTDLTPVLARIEGLERGVDRSERTQRDELSCSRREVREELERIRMTVTKELESTLRSRLTEAFQLVGERLEQVGQRLSEVRATANEELTASRREVREELERIRHTVDEKLETTLERRLSESFQRVSERLEQVYRGLGEMQALASEVGDVKRALTNVRTRGTWGEVHAGALLDELLSPEQFGRNVAVTGGAERVEFAIRMPGDRLGPVWLPIDAKFPLEDYLRLVDAAERGDLPEIETHGKKLEDRVRECAKTISRKYLAPPLTTDFAILYLPTESLFAEVLRRPGVVELLQRDYRVTLAGPTTLAAFLNSLKMGFRTLAIQQRSSEVWGLLGEVKTEFARYSEVLAKVHKKLQEASNTVDAGLVRTRAIERKLRDVQELPGTEDDAEAPLQRFLAAGD